MKVVKYTLVIAMLFATLQIVAQEKKKSEDSSNKIKITKTVATPNSTQAVAGDVSFSDGTNQLLRITDEGNFGVIQFQDGVPSNTDHKLYRNGLDLYFGTSNLSSGGSGVNMIDDLDDAKYDGESLFIGDGAGASDDAGASDGITNFNLGVGRDALNANVTGKSNTAIGGGAQKLNQTGNFNTAIGASTLRYQTSGEYNTAIGFGANYYNSSPSQNTMIGYFAGRGAGPSIHPGSGNIFLGFKAGYNETRSDRLYIENSDSDTPLIYGNFNNDSLIINGQAHIKTSLSVGFESVATGPYSISVGSDNYSHGSQSSAFGLGLNSMSLVSTAIGRYNVGYFVDGASQSNWVETEPVFEIGNGTDDANRSNAVTVLKNGNVGFGPSDPTASLHVDAVNGVVFNGLTSGGIPVEGSGSRMMWYQGKSAFRAGNAGFDNQWDDVNIGQYSAAFNYRTKAKGTYSFATGYETEALGQRSTAMGSDAKAAGDFSTAIGSKVHVSGTGTIFIGDNSSTGVHNATSDNRFAARFAGGYKFFTSSDLSSFALLETGQNSWNTTSDSTKKANFLPVDGEEVLNKISKFKLTSWNYKTQDPTKFRHYGPMAQDFYSAFGNDGIGTIGNDTTIASADFDGINLIAIQGLENRTKNQKTSIENQVLSIKNLETRIEVLEKQNKQLVKLNTEYRKSNLEFRNEIELIKQSILSNKKTGAKNKVASAKVINP